MATNKKTIEFTAKNVKAFTGWLKRFSTIDKSLLLEIDQTTSTFTAKTYNEERSVVKMSSIKFDDAGLLTSAKPESKRIKVGLYNISHLTKIMDQFNDVEFTITVEYQELISDSDTQYAAEKILLKNKLLKMNVDCTSLNIFKYISDELFKTGISTVDSILDFELTKANIEKISTLNNLDDSDEKNMEFKIGDNKTIVSGKVYELSIGENTIKEPFVLSIFKDQFVSLDVENYDVNLGEDRLVFKSKESNTTTVISKAEKE
jgi:hypothetical protein